MAAMSLRTCSAPLPLSTAHGYPTHRPRLRPPRPCLRSRRTRRRRRPRCPRRPRRPRCRRSRRALPSRRGWHRCPCRGSPSTASASVSPPPSSAPPSCSTSHGRLTRDTMPLAARMMPMRPRTAAKGPPLARGDPMGPTGEGCRRVSAPITVARCRRAWQPHQVASHLGT